MSPAQPNNRAQPIHVRRRTAEKPQTTALRRSRVVPGLASTIPRCRVSRLNNVVLPTLGRPTRATFAFADIAMCICIGVVTDSNSKFVAKIGMQENCISRPLVVWKHLEQIFPNILVMGRRSLHDREAHAAAICQHLGKFKRQKFSRGQLHSKCRRVEWREFFQR